jgi:hypothetical protein
MISPLATHLDVKNNGKYLRAGIGSQLSSVLMVAFCADLRVAPCEEI